jgi:hypothetical protein
MHLRNKQLRQTSKSIRFLMVVKHQNQLWKMINAISLSISPFLVIDANPNQSKYKV